jgi:hypothetical protein
MYLGAPAGSSGTYPCNCKPCSRSRSAATGRDLATEACEALQLSVVSHRPLDELGGAATSSQPDDQQATEERGLPGVYFYGGQWGRQKFSGQPENQINALGVHCANCVDLSYPGARIRAMMACSSICFIPSSLRSSGPSDEARVSVDLREGGETAVPSGIYFL